MKFLPFTSVQGDKVYINTDAIHAFDEFVGDDGSRCSRLYMADHTAMNYAKFWVQDAFDEIADRLNESGGEG